MIVISGSGILLKNNEIKKGKTGNNFLMNILKYENGKTDMFIPIFFFGKEIEELEKETVLGMKIDFSGTLTHINKKLSDGTYDKFTAINVNKINSLTIPSVFENLKNEK